MLFVDFCFNHLFETAIFHAKPRARSGVKEGRNLDPPPPKPAKNLKNLSLL
jgi:hypothetical protein